jgi:hypothetical protein
MTTRHGRARRRTRPQTPQEGFLSDWLDPIDRLSETIYSILILLTFTLAYRVFRLSTESPPLQPTDEYVLLLLFGALGAIFAWGVIDGIMYALTSLFDRLERRRLAWHIQAAATDSEAVEAIADELDYILEPITGDAQRQVLYEEVLKHLREAEPREIGLKRGDFTGALACVFVAVYSVLPSLVPLVLLRDNYPLAIRLSNVISFIVLFITGYQWGKYTGANPWKTGLILLGVGALLVAVAIILGG